MTAAAAKTETNFNIMGEVPVESSVTIATQNDWIVLPHKGTTEVIGKNFYDGGTEDTAVDHATITVNLVAGYDADDTSIVYNGATALQRTSGGYYVINDATGEIMEVITDSGYTTTAGTIVVRRGALGSTAAAITNDDALYVLNCLIFTSSNVGTHLFRYFPLPFSAGCGIYE